MINRRLTDDQFNQVKNLSLSGLKPSDILHFMKNNEPEDAPLLATKSTIYVAKRRINQEARQGLSPIVHLSNQLVFSEYTTQTMVDEEGTLKALFFAHFVSLRDSIVQLNTFQMAST